MEARGPDRASWRLFGVLVVAGFVGVVAVLPLTLSLLRPLAATGPGLPPLWVVLLLTVLQGLVLVAAATALGLWLGPRVGLGVPLLERLLRGERQARAQLGGMLVPSVTLGALVAGVIAALDLWVFAPGLPAASAATGPLAPSVWPGLLASLYGGVTEELMLRLGVMTVLVWVGARLTRSSEPGPVVMWTAIVLTAVLFGAGHLPATAAVWPLTPLVVARALLLNGVGGVAFGWLYWRRGLLAAMTAHLSADILLHVLTPLLS